MGYTIFIHPQVTPKTIKVEVQDEPRWIEPVYSYPEPEVTYDNDGNPIGMPGEVEPVLVSEGHWAEPSTHLDDQLNPVPAPVYPPTYSRKIWATREMDHYSADPKRRAELWEDSEGVATYADIVAVFPQLPLYTEMAARNWGMKQLSALAAPYATPERETWHVQQREAEAWLADTAAPAPMITALATARGITIAELVEKIMGNVNQFRVLSGQILGKQQALIDRAYGADSIDGLLAIAAELGINLMEI